METKKYLPELGDVPTLHVSESEMAGWDDERLHREIDNRYAEIILKHAYPKENLPNNGIVSLNQAEKTVRKAMILYVHFHSIVDEAIEKLKPGTYERAVADNDARFFLKNG